MNYPAPVIYLHLDMKPEKIIFKKKRTIKKNVQFEKNESLRKMNLSLSVVCFRCAIVLT